MNSYTKFKIVFTSVFLGLVLVTNLAGAALVPTNCQRAAIASSSTSCQLTELVTLAANIVNYLLATAGTIALLFVVYGGVQMLLSGGNPETIKNGKTTLYNAFFGFAMVLGAYIIINLVVNKLSGGSITDFDSLRNFIR